MEPRVELSEVHEVKTLALNLVSMVTKKDTFGYVMLIVRLAPPTVRLTPWIATVIADSNL